MAVSLVTGGAGFIGSHVAEHLLALGREVVVLDDLSGGSRTNVPRDAVFVEGSILDAGLVERIFAEWRIDHVYHLAAYAAEGLSHFIRRFNYSHNLVGSANLVNASVNHGVQCFVFTSSIAVYGTSQARMTEEQPPRPEDPYGIAKLAVEQDLAAAHAMFGLDYVMFRPHNVYGERQNIGDRYRNVVGIFMNQLLQGQPMTIFGDGEQKRAFTHVSDIASVIAQAPFNTAARNQVFNLGSDTAATVKDLARLVAAALGCEHRVVFLPGRNEVKVSVSDHGKCRRVFGDTAMTSLETGLRAMAKWVRAHGAQQVSVFDEIEIERGLPENWARALKSRRT